MTRRPSCEGDPGPWQTAQAWPGAIAICCECPLVTPCTEAAIRLREDRWFVWGGLTPRQRQAMIDAREATLRAYNAPPGEKGRAAILAKKASYMRRWSAGQLASDAAADLDLGLDGAAA